MIEKIALLEYAASHSRYGIGSGIIDYVLTRPSYLPFLGGPARAWEALLSIISYLATILHLPRETRLNLFTLDGYRITNSLCISPVTRASVSPTNIFTSERMPKSFR